MLNELGIDENTWRLLVETLEAWLDRHPEPERPILVLGCHGDVTSGRMVRGIREKDEVGRHFLILLSMQAAEEGWESVLQTFREDFQRDAS